MITASTLTILTSLSKEDLTDLIRAAGYKKDKFESAKFNGFSNGKQFVYNVTFIEDGILHPTKVFVSYDSTRDKSTIDY